MPEWVWLVAVVVIAAVVVAVVIARRRRSAALRDRFGPEYEHVAGQTGSERKADAELAARQRRVERFDIRELTPEERASFQSQWERVQVGFVDSPAAAVSEADGLVQQVMASRGYPVDDFEQRSADLSVEHPEIVANYRAAHGISMASAHGRASTEDLRQATIYYRALFGELLGEQRSGEPRSGEVVDLREEEAPRYR
jgi:hypothetical protein